MGIEEWKFTPSGKPRSFTNEQEAEVGLRYTAGEGACVLAREFGCTPGTVYKSLKRQGITIRNRHNARPRTEFIISGYVWSPIDFDNPIEVAMQMKSGYKYILKHRKVMANHIGRPLRTDEQVHHIDGSRGNNDISNLQLRQGQHGSGVAMKCLNCGSDNVESVPLATPNDHLTKIS